MTRKQFHTAFNILYDKSTNSLAHPSFLSAEKDAFIDLAIREIVKTRFSGRNPMGKGFQQNQKRTDDLRTVVVPKNYTVGSGLTIVGDLCSADYPTDYWFSVGENVTISYGNPAVTKEVDVAECTIDNVTSKINSSLSEHHMRNNTAKPLRWFSDGMIYLYKDSDYTITKYTLIYVKKPETFTRTTQNENTEYTGMPEHIHDEIVSYAVRLALGSIGDERYQIQTAENQIIE